MNSPDDLAHRRRTRGWFGEPWPSGVCLKQDDQGADLVPWQYDYEMQVPTPVGTPCLYCHEPIVEGDQGQLTPYVNAEREVTIVPAHRECSFRQVMGPLAHLEKRCSCYGGTDHTTPGFTERQEALAVWDYVVTRRMLNG